MIKDLSVGMLVAVSGSQLPKVGKVHSIADAQPTMESAIVVQWLVQEQAKHKPRWLRPYKASKNESFGTIKYSDLLLYDFQLTTVDV